MNNVEVDAAVYAREQRHGLGRAEFIALSAMISTTIAISIDTILPAFSEMERDFDLDESGGQVSLAITVFLIALGAGMLVWGPLADRYGRKPIMYLSLAAFVAGALVSTLAGSFSVFLLGRVIWGVAAAGPRTIGLAIVRDCYDGDLMARIMSLTTAVFLIVPILAPGVGELMLAIGSWRLTTLVGAVLGVVVAVWLVRLNETLDPDHIAPLEFGRLAEAGRLVVTNPRTMLLTVATTFAYGAFFPWLGSSVQMIETIYDRPELFALLFGANAGIMALAILVTERLVARFSTYPVLRAESVVLVSVAALYVIWSLASSGTPAFWVWFTLVTILTSLNSSVTPLMQTLSLEPMGRIAGMASSITGAIVFAVGATLGGIVDRFITDTVTPFGVGFVLYGLVALGAVVAAHRVPVSPAARKS